MLYNKEVESGLNLISTIITESRILGIRTPIIIFVNVINILLHIYEKYNQNETFAYVCYDNELRFVKETELFDDENKVYDITREPLDIDLQYFNSLIELIGYSTSDEDIIVILNEII